ncbi:hypothetical protein AVO41_00540 [Thiomicrospira sp. WB1]|nr:HD domain-containing protein [Thiomicrospira sp. WB1]KUJ72338.1 hypothetical protein AVO41_00540 [Thiomicrospira sp. WB1]
MMYTYPPQLLKRQREYLLEAVIAVIIGILLTALVLYPLLVKLLQVVNQQKRTILKGNLEMMTLLGSAISKRDSDTDAHNFRVTLYAIALAEAHELPLSQRRALLKGAFVHDIGKIAISDTVLLKPGRLTADEFAIMKKWMAVATPMAWPETTFRSMLVFSRWPMSSMPSHPNAPTKTPCRWTKPSRFCEQNAATISTQS